MARHQISGNLACRSDGALRDDGLPRPYAFVARGSAAGFVDDVAQCIATDGIARAAVAQPGHQVMSDIKARTRPADSLSIKSLYWSVQNRDPAVWGGLRARTLRAERGGIEWHSLPEDPALPALAGLAAIPGRWAVLRYVPFRRATLLHQALGGQACIVKVKRPDRAVDAAHRLRCVAEALKPLPEIGIPTLLQEPQDGVFSFSFRPGRPLALPPSPDRATALLRRIGQMHAALHDTPATALPMEEVPSAAEELETAAQLCPSFIPRLAMLAARLRQRPEPGVSALCHGDLALDQFLMEGEALSLVDFDRSHAGDPAADVARFMVHLAEQALGLLPRALALEAYLQGYAERRALPASEPLGWHLANAAAARVMIRIRKDQVDPRAMSEILDLGCRQGAE